MKPAVEQMDRQLVYDEEARMVGGWASVELKDSDGQIVPIDTLEKLMPIWINRGAPIQFQHSNKQIGRAVNWFKLKHPSGAEGIYLMYKIFKDYPFEKEIWEGIKGGKYSGLSIGGMGKGGPLTKDELGQVGESLKINSLFEVSVCEQPANPYALNTMANLIAKTHKSEEYKKYLEDIQKPFAGYENFADCKAKNSDKDNPDAYCGYMMRQTEGEKSTERLDLSKQIDLAKSIKENLHLNIT